MSWMGGWLDPELEELFQDDPELLETAKVVRASRPVVEPDPRFQNRLRAQLVAEGSRGRAAHGVRRCSAPCSLVLPLSFRVDRGPSTLSTGLLLAPQGIGAALTMPISGRLTDRLGGGRVVLFGMVVMTLGTVALTRFGAHTPYSTTCAVLVARGIGLGCSLMPATASAYTTISRAAIPRATTALNVLQRVGGSIGTALLAVVLQDQIKAAVPGASGIGGGAIALLPPAMRARIAEPLATAFSNTFWYAAALTAVAIVLAIKVRGPAPAAAAPEPPGAAQAA